MDSLLSIYSFHRLHRMTPKKANNFYHGSYRAYSKLKLSSQRPGVGVFMSKPWPHCSHIKLLKIFFFSFEVFFYHSQHVGGKRKKKEKSREARIEKKQQHKEVKKERFNPLSKCKFHNSNYRDLSGLMST